MSIWISQRTIKKAKEKMYKQIKDERIFWLSPFRLVWYMVSRKKCRSAGASPDEVLSKFDSKTCDINDMANLLKLFEKWGDRFGNELALRAIARPENKLVLENVRQIWNRYYKNRENKRGILEGIPEIEPLIAKFTGGMSKYYQRFKIPKKDGTKRLIEAPVKELIEVQRTILNKILYPCYPKTKSNPAHGFLPLRGILSNASVHENARIIVNLDLKNAFTSTTEEILSLSLEDYFTEAGTKMLLKLCCLNGRLPQGAPTSPMLLNYSLISMDRRMNSFVTSVGWRYSRYADDLTFSCEGKDSGTIGIGTLIEKATKLVAEDYGYKINKKKIRVCKPKRAMTVTGLTLNSGKPTISRKIRRMVRAKVHNYVTKGIGNTKEIAGHISFIALCHKEYAENLKKQLENNQPAVAIPNN